MLTGMLGGMRIGGPELVGMIVAVSFAAGLNVYATVGTLGLLAQAGLLDLPSGLHLLSNWWVIAAACALFAVEFFADKIPAFDLFWNALHTFVRVPVAALLAYGATSQLSPEKQLLAAFAGGAIALVAHGGKTAARVAVTPSPEPFSNFALSMSEDTLAVFLTWFATRHPIAAGVTVAAFLTVIVVLSHWVVRMLKNIFRGAQKPPSPRNHDQLKVA
ncbi:MAG: DUF4126 domain-containing protein [Terriglobales bacterium]|jgi:hypothetical protein